MKYQSMVVVALSAGLVGQAQAGFAVYDDAPVITAANIEVARKPKTVYASFAGQRMQSNSRAEIETAADASQYTDSVTITTFAKTQKQLGTAHRRIFAVRAILVRRGIPAERITISAEIDPYADELDLDVQVSFRPAQQRPSLDSLRAVRSSQPQFAQTSAPVAQVAVPLPPPAQAYPYAAAPAATSNVSAAAAQGQSAVKLEFVKKIMAMASSKLISQESAIKLVNEYLANMAPVQGQSPQEPANVLPSTTPQIVPFGEAPRVWTLAGNKSLRDNIRDWAITAGYGEPVWTASNPYQVTYTSTYTGTFLEVLNQIANTVPTIDFRVSRNAHRVEVVDHI